MSRDNYRDSVIRQFADDERELLERLASVEDDRDSYRELAQQTIHALHHLTRRHEQLREQHARVQDAYQRLRAEIMTKAAAA